MSKTIFKTFSVIIPLIIFMAGLFFILINKESKKIVLVNDNLQEESGDTQDFSIGKEDNQDNQEEEVDTDDNQQESSQEIVDGKMEAEKAIDNEVVNQEEEKEEEQADIVNKKVSWGYKESSGRKIDTIVIHSSYDALGSEPYDLDGLIAEFKQYGVAAHYLIDRKGIVYQLVSDKNIAYHAGVSQVPDGRNNVNNFSVGVELMNTKDDEYTKDQYASLSGLISLLKNRYEIKYVLGHDDIAPERKTDPWNFDWDEIK